MRRTCTTLLATAALLCMPAAASLAQKPPGQVGVSLTAKPNPVTFSQPVELKVSVKGAKGGVTVVLQSHLTSSTSFTDSETKTTDTKGDVTFTPRPRETTYYRVVARTAPDQVSAELIVKVAPLVGLKVSDSTPRSGQRVLFSGTVRPAHEGRRVYLQRRIGAGAFVTVAKTTLRAGTSTYSKYSMRRGVSRTATYRVRILGHTDHSIGISRERVLTTH